MPTESPSMEGKLHIIFWGFSLTDHETINRLFRERMLSYLQLLWTIEENDIKVDFPAQVHKHHFGTSGIIVDIRLPPYLESDRTVKAASHRTAIATIIGETLQSYFSNRRIECNVTLTDGCYWRSKA